MSISEISVRRPVTTYMVVLIVVILGAVSFWKIPIDLMPEITFPTVTISTEYENVNPQEIETLLTEPIERAVSSVEGVEEVSSVSVEGRSQVRVSFGWGTDLDAATSDVREKIDRVRDNLPREAKYPVISKYDVNASPIIFAGVAGDLDPISLRTFVEERLRHRLERVRGVSAADVRGGLEREIHVDLSLAKLRALQLAPADIVSVLTAANVNLPAGHLDRGHLELTVRTLGEFASLEQIRSTVIARRGATPVYLRDVATVRDSFKEIDHVVRIDGRNAVMVSILKQPGANTVAVTDLVKREIERINRDYPNIRASVVFDHARYIRQSIDNVLIAGIWGGTLAVVIILFFLRNVRSTLIVSTAIPVSIIATFALMYFQGFTINMMSFGGLALGIGMLLDNSIVVLENIFRHRERGEERREAVLRGTREVASAITASTLTTLAVFLPLIFIPGPAGILFKQLAWVVFFALAVSLVVALTLVPVMTYHLLKTPPRERERGTLAAAFRAGKSSLEALDGAYQRLLVWSLDHKALVLMSAISLVALSLYLLPYIGREFMPKADEGEVRVLAEMEEGTKIEKMNEAFQSIEAAVRGHVPEAQNVFTHFGAFGFRARGKNTGHVHVWLVPKSARERSDAEIARSLAREVDSIPGLVARVRPRAGLFIFRRLGLAEDDNLEVQLRGHDLARAQELAQQIKETMARIDGLVGVRINREGGQPELGVHIDRERAAALGVSVTTIARTVETSLIGTRATLYREGGDEFDVRVRLAETDRGSPRALLNIAVPTASGRLVPLKDLIRVEERRGPMEIHRLNQERTVTLSGQVTGRDMGSVVRELEARLRQIRLPEDFSILFGGDYREQQESFRELSWGLLLALLLVYMVMAAQFESLRDPLLIMGSVPVAVVGIVLVLLLTGTSLNVNSFIGIIMLSGIVVNNAIVLVDYTNLKMREDGLKLREAVVVGGRTRLRPILMTTLTTVLAMIPLGLGIAEGGEVQAPLARVVIGGLSVSALITLVLIPVLYTAVGEWRALRAGEVAGGAWRLANGRLSRK